MVFGCFRQLQSALPLPTIEPSTHGKIAHVSESPRHRAQPV